MRQNRPRPLGNILDDLIEDRGMATKLNAARILETWQEISGPSIQSVTKAAWLKGRILFVQITSATWRQELFLSREAWCKKLNHALEAQQDQKDLATKIDQIIFR